MIKLAFFWTTIGFLVLIIKYLIEVLRKK